MRSSFSRWLPLPPARAMFAWVPPPLLLFRCRIVLHSLERQRRRPSKRAPNETSAIDNASHEMQFNITSSVIYCEIKLNISPCLIFLRSLLLHRLLAAPPRAPPPGPASLRERQRGCIYHRRLGGVGRERSPDGVDGDRVRFGSRYVHVSNISRRALGFPIKISITLRQVDRRPSAFERVSYSVVLTRCISLPATDRRCSGSDAVIFASLSRSLAQFFSYESGGLILMATTARALHPCRRQRAPSHASIQCLHCNEIKEECQISANHSRFNSVRCCHRRRSLAADYQCKLQRRFGGRPAVLGRVLPQERSAVHVCSCTKCKSKA